MVDPGAPAKLRGARSWNRGVLDKTRAFSVPRQWFSVLAAGHVPELYKATQQETDHQTHMAKFLSQDCANLR